MGTKGVTTIKSVFLVCGLGMLGGAIYLVQDTRDFIARAITAEGEVVDMEARSDDDGTTYAPIVNFTTRQGEDMQFVSSMSSSPPAYDRGEKVEVLYLEDNPYDARINGIMSLWFGPGILGFLGTVFTAVGGGTIFVPVLMRRRQAKIKRFGRRIQTKLQHADVVQSVEINGRNPFRIVTQWQNPQTNKIHVFESENIFFDPLEYIHTDTIEVWVDNDDLDRYHMDISFLPELAD